MPTPFSSSDLGRIFDSRNLTRGRSLVLTGAVEVQLDGDVITGTVQAPDGTQQVRIVPAALGPRVVFDNKCSCGMTGCMHLAAAAYAALDRFPALRKAEQQSFLDNLVAAGRRQAETETLRTTFELAPGEAPAACVVTTLRIGEQTGRLTQVTPADIAADQKESAAVRELARKLGGGAEARIPVAIGQVAELLPALLRSGRARWHAGGKRLVSGDMLVLAAASASHLPRNSGVIVGETGPWYVDAFTGAVGRITIRPLRVAAGPASTAKSARPDAARRRPEPEPARRRNEPVATEQVIVERPPIPSMRLTRFPGRDEYGRPQDIDALVLDFDYAGMLVPVDDDRQFVRVESSGGPYFLRRDRAAEGTVLEALRKSGFVQMRMAMAKSERGRLVFIFRGRDAAESWQRFMAEELPELQARDWRSVVDPGFGPRMAGTAGPVDMRVADAAQGGFSLDFGIEIDGTRQPLLPILMRLHEAGGMAAARVVDGQVSVGLEDGRIASLPAERIARLLAVIDDLIEQSRRRAGNELVLDAAEAPTVLDLEDLVITRWQDGAAIADHVARFRGVEDIPDVALPASFRGELRPYQQQGVNWLQHLRQGGLGGLLADDMGLGKTAQTIAHVCIEAAAGRLTSPVLVVVPTSLVPNWSAELARFAPHLRVAVLHGLDRHERRGNLAGVQVVITTYTVLSRDIEEMVGLAWHMVVLDEAQAIKSPTSKATHAVCRLETTHRVCLSGTPIENNLGELWSQFAFVMPGLLGHRKSFNKRFRGPIERAGDPVRQRQLALRIRPFILRRTKAAVATELPPKNTILRRITLAPEQRELYETIRATLHEKVSEEVAAHSLARSQVVVLDALLKLRQVCCDPRLVKLPSAKLIDTSSKLEDLLEIVGEMVTEGRRILLFSQFTSMLDLIRPRLEQAGIGFVELRGDTRDRATPVERFQTGEVPVFLISLKAGGRGLNLTAADTVIHYDPWWNPAVEDQASDRAHRIGQTKSVFVYKMIAADTVEERVLELQARKAALASIAFGEDAAGVGAMDETDIEFLFGASPDLLAA